MSALPPKAGIDHNSGNVRFVPKADSRSAAQIRLVEHRAEARSLVWTMLAQDSIHIGQNTTSEACREVSEPLRRLIHRKCLNALVETGQHHNADRDEDDRKQHSCVRSA